LSVIDQLVKKYSAVVRLPWPGSIAGPERVWMLVYPPKDERRLRAKLGEFEIATKTANHDWGHVDLTNSFGEWMAQQEYRESYFENPGDMGMLLDVYGRYAEQLVVKELADAKDNAVVGVVGLGSLFGLYSVSSLLEGVNSQIPGRLLAFFPGVRDGSNYRLLDAKDGFNYMAIPIDVSGEDEL
jgi:hypothetical protein